MTNEHDTPATPPANARSGMLSGETKQSPPPKLDNLVLSPQECKRAEQLAVAEQLRKHRQHDEDTAHAD